MFPERLKATWRSPIYGFFKPKVTIGYDDKGCKYHYFRCAARKCKLNGGVKRNQTTKDKGATSNLKTHAIKCHGEDVVNAAIKGREKGQDHSIFACFARVGQKPVKFSHRTHTNPESRSAPSSLNTSLCLKSFRAHIARWCAESNRPFAIVKDRQFHELMMAGRPSCFIPSPTTVGQDVKLAFERSRQRIDTILKVCSHIYFIEY